VWGEGDAKYGLPSFTDPAWKAQGETCMQRWFAPPREPHDVETEDEYTC
jgi:hypothetical protein